MQINGKTLCNAVNNSFRKYDNMRKARVQFVAQYVGRFYSRLRSGSMEERKASPVNQMHTAVNTFVPNLVFNDPKIKLRSQYIDYRNYTNIAELAINHQIKTMKLRLELRQVVYDSLFMAGFMKTGLAASNEIITIDGMDFKLGRPFAERVDPDNMIFDVNARVWDEQTIMGDRYRVDRDDLLENEEFDSDVVKKLASWGERSSAREQRVENISDKQRPMGDNKLVDYVELADVWIPKDNVIRTLPYANGQCQDLILAEREFNGPDTGMYHMLGYSFVPDNLLPVPPAAVWYDLQVMINRLTRKIRRQSDRSKQVLVYDGESIDDAKTIIDAADGDVLGVNDIDRLKEIGLGGTSESVFRELGFMEQKFSEQALNVDLLSGTAANAPTATQSQILQTNSSIRIADLQNLVYHFTAEVARDIFFYLHTDPLIDMPLIQRTKGQEDQQVRYTPEERQGDWIDYNVDVEPYSMARQDPNVKLRRLLELFSTAVPGIAQTAQILGPGFNVENAINLVMREMGIETNDELFSSEEIREFLMVQLTKGLGAGPGKAESIPGNSALNLGQPNPLQQGPTGGISPEAEFNSQQQDIAGDLQAGQF